ncbi:hypothetical protein HEP87_64610 [Streptomyces sp. S1D4-11]|nr:hypothetical protein [Streptomyces sp. S1D4-11]
MNVSTIAAALGFSGMALWTIGHASSDEPSQPPMVVRIRPPGRVCSIQAAGTVRTPQVAITLSYGAPSA